MSVGIRADIPSDVARTTICVDRLRDGELFGRFYNPYTGAVIGFVGLAALIHGMESLFDRLSYPQRTPEQRTFRVRAAHRRNHGEQVGVGEMDKEKEVTRGERATFVVSVQFRQNATWQGTVSWSEQKESRRFHSVLELISLMNDALIEGDSLASWEETTEGDERQ